MTRKQNLLYFRLWGMARRADPSLDRKALHGELGLPESHLDFSNADLDAWKARCLALAEPSNYNAQLAQVRMPATRRAHTVRMLAAALGVGDSYVQGVIARAPLRDDRHA